MRIQKILSQNRRDFTAIYECEHCGSTREGSGYDDTNFHVHVIPAMECGSCGRTADAGYMAKETKYPDGVQV